MTALLRQRMLARVGVVLRWRHALRSAGVVLLLASLLTACAPTTRYKVLSFFFDGVPPPPGMEIPDVNPEEFTSDLQAYKAALTSLPQRELPEMPPPIVSVHAPVQDNQCTECHDFQRGMEGASNNTALCDRCHGERRIADGWDHGPMNLGTCLPCHRAHDSPYPHLLDQETPDLCLYCHDHGLAESTIEHDTPDFNQCLLCHDPHNAELKEGRPTRDSPLTTRADSATSGAASLALLSPTDSPTSGTLTEPAISL